MAFRNDNLAKLAFKTLLGKAHTDGGTGVDDNNQGLGIFNEPYESTLNLTSNLIWTDEIDSNPENAVIAGVAKKFTFNLELSQSSNGQAYVAKWGFPLPAGAPLWAVEYEVVRNAIPISYGPGYIDVVNSGLDTIYPTDRDWFFQYNVCVYFQDIEYASYPAPTTVDLYVYIGRR